MRGVGWRTVRETAGCGCWLAKTWDAEGRLVEMDQLVCPRHTAVATLPSGLAVRTRTQVRPEETDRG